jgi:hypothetical protein
MLKISQTSLEGIINSEFEGKEEVRVEAMKDVEGADDGLPLLEDEKEATVSDVAESSDDQRSGSIIVDPVEDNSDVPNSLKRKRAEIDDEMTPVVGESYGNCDAQNGKASAIAATSGRDQLGSEGNR